MRVKSLISVVVSIAVLLVCFSVMQNNYDERFAEMQKRYNENVSINLDGNVNEQELADILYRNGYVPKTEDAKFIARFLRLKFRNDTLPQAVTDLNKKDFQVPFSMIEEQGTPYFKEVLHNAYLQLGQTAATDSLYKVGVPATFKAGDGTESITVNVKQKKAEHEKGVFDELLRKSNKPVGGVLVRLDVHELDSTNKDNVTILGYAMTDADGKVVFDGLDAGASYSVLPIKKGFEFGVAKGTTQGSLEKALEDSDGEVEYGFIMQTHTLRLFSPQTIQCIKDDTTLTVRTPEMFTSTLQKWFTAFVCMALLLVIVGNAGRRRMDNGMAALLMLVAGFSLMLMFGINNPLTERLLGVDSALGVVVGLGVAIMLQFIDINRFYLDESKLFGKKMVFDAPAWLGAGGERQKYLKFKGYSYLVLAIVMTASLFVIGQSIGGMYVNIKIGPLVFQPSEIAKFLVVFFMATWFCRNSSTIIRYSEEAATNQNADANDAVRMFGLKLRHMLPVIIGLGLMMLVYTKLGDMGPALVLAMTFIILYSLVKSRPVKGSRKFNILDCDLAWLAYGVLSYVGVLFIGHWLGIMMLASILWFVGWILLGLGRKQIHESPVLFNIIISMFVFLPVVLKGTDVGDRLAQRVEMCTNTWGNLALNGGTPAPGVNTQVAEGQWALSSGGWTGQGIGMGLPSSIPEHHTDFILESIGEQLGFVGIFFIVTLLTLLLWKTLLAGYNSRHHFTLFLCTGIAVVTGLQFLIIALGSTGIIPLTGVTVPMLSYGKVSLILNLMAFGMVLSVTSHKQKATAMAKNQQEPDFMADYGSPVVLTGLGYSVMVLFVLGVFFRYQVLDRDEILLRPVFVYDKNGAASIQYNPRINKLAAMMKPGDIYDRNGLLVATSFSDSLEQFKNVYEKYGVQTDFRKVQDRYYPFGEHLFFMLGDYNNKLYFSSVNNSPRGYMAEARHLAELRGYDNMLRNSEGKGVKVLLNSDKYKPGRFFAADSKQQQMIYQLRDYRDLLPYLKEGYASERVARFNARQETLFDLGKIEPKDIRLTVDAKLQTRLQQALAGHDPAEKRYSHLQRTSVVVLDAGSGDVLASAVWPLPDYDRMAREAKDNEVYFDRYRKKGEWTAYTDMDLGITFPTPPGSTAKVMSALAGARHMSGTDDSLDKHNYMVYRKEVIHADNNGNPVEPIGRVSLERAIVKSSNNYFINLVNDLDLYDELAKVYEGAGIWIGSGPAYMFNYDAMVTASDWKGRVTEGAEAATKKYREYIEQRKPNNTDTHMRMRGNTPWQWTWGQGTMGATPLGMARIAATVVNGGKMPVTRFLLSDEKPQTIDIADSVKVKPIKEAMVKEAHVLLTDKKSRRFANWPTVGGKTGTPERNLDTRPKKGQTPAADRIPVNPEKANDGWYICFVEDASVSKVNAKGKKETVKTPLAIAVRAERTVTSGSSYAKNIADKLVLPTLAKEGYVPAPAN